MGKTKYTSYKYSVLVLEVYYIVEIKIYSQRVVQNEMNIFAGS